MASGQHTIEHLDGYWKMLEADDSPFRRDDFDYHSYITTWNYIDEGKMPAVASLTEACGGWNCPTLVVYQRNGSPAEADSVYELPEMKYMDPVSLASWDPTTYFATRNLTKEKWEADHSSYHVLTEFTGYLHKAGARLLLGIDCPNPFVVPGFSINTELQNFVKASMSPFEAIKTGTYNAADYLGARDQFGVIATGRRADLILLNATPLEDVDNTTKRVGVMARGRWLSENELQTIFEDIVSSYTPPNNRFEGIAEIESRGRLIQNLRYELRYNDVPFGEERCGLFALDSSGYKLISQTITDRPYYTLTTVKMTLDGSYGCDRLEYLNETGTGRNSLLFIRSHDSLQISGNLRSGEEVHKSRSILREELINPPRVSVCVSDVPAMASYLQVSRMLLNMAVGDSLVIRSVSHQLALPLELSEETIVVKRLHDSEKQNGAAVVPLRMFSYDITFPDVETRSLLSTDATGIVVSFEVEQQIGILSIHLLSKG